MKMNKYAYLYWSRDTDHYITDRMNYTAKDSWDQRVDKFLTKVLPFVAIGIGYITMCLLWAAEVI